MLSGLSLWLPRGTGSHLSAGKPQNRAISVTAQTVAATTKSPGRPQDDSFADANWKGMGEALDQYALDPHGANGIGVKVAGDQSFALAARGPRRNAVNRSALLNKLLPVAQSPAVLRHLHHVSRRCDVAYVKCATR
jgi:hypothetical protein